MNFSMSELIYSDTANRLNINNMPDINSMDNMFYLICDCLQPCRELLNAPMVVTSGYRCKELNSSPLIRGANTSQHVKGEACDFYVIGMSVEEAFKKIKSSGIIFDQLINEYDKWIHISYRKGNNRQQAFKL